MNNLLFTTLLIALIYYFFFYLPNQKKPINPNPILTHSQSTQTDNDEPTPKGMLNCPRPILNEPAALKPPEDTSALEKTIDQLIKSMTDLAHTIK